jgi:hypothetical protein
MQSESTLSKETEGNQFDQAIKRTALSSFGHFSEYGLTTTLRICMELWSFPRNGRAFPRTEDRESFT